MRSPALHHNLEKPGPPEKAPLLGREMTGFAPASFASARSNPDEKRSARRRGAALPQAIAHRGYKAEYPENTMDAFRAAVAVGAHAIETDLHLSRDKVVVLSHDATLTRCFGEKKKIADCDWRYLSSLRTLRKPNSPMPRLVDLLEYLSQPGLEDIWVLLDIKRDDDPDELLRRTAETFASTSGPRPWRDRIVMGCWDANYIRRCQEHLPGFPIAFIGLSLPYARQLFKYDGVSFNLLQQILVGPCGSRFLKEAKMRGRNVFVWTVNQEQWMEWSIRKAVDGVITDDPRLYLEVCRRWEDGSDESGSDDTLRKRSGQKHVLKWARLYTEAYVVQGLFFVIIILFRIALGSERRRVQRALRR